LPLAEEPHALLGFAVDVAMAKEASMPHAAMLPPAGTAAVLDAAFEPKQGVGARLLFACSFN